MLKDCPDSNGLERLLGEEFDSEAERDRWRSHLETCPECTELLLGHRELLQGLGQLSSPHLSPYFDQTIRERLVSQKRRTSSLRVKRLLLQGYWLAALGLAFLILDSLEVPVRVTSAAAVTLVVSGVLTVLTLGFAMSRLDLGITDLLLDIAVDPEL